MDNYARYRFEAFWTQILNSSLTALGTTVGVVVLGVMAAFVIARYEFRGRDALYSLFTAGLLFPITVAVLPLYLLLRSFGLLGTLVGIAIPQIAFALPVTIIILVPFLRAIPGELEDAAVIDGTSRFGFFWRILLPLSGPGLVTVGVLAFVGNWNAYLCPADIEQTGELHPPSGFGSSTTYSQDGRGARVHLARDAARADLLLAGAAAHRQWAHGRSEGLEEE